MTERVLYFGWFNEQQSERSWVLKSYKIIMPPSLRNTTDINRRRFFYLFLKVNDRAWLSDREYMQGWILIRDRCASNPLSAKQITIFWFKYASKRLLPCNLMESVFVFQLKFIFFKILFKIFFCKFSKK